MKAIERLYQYLEFKELKPTYLEKEIGLSNGYIGVQKKRNADMGEGILLKILDYCRDMDPVWLLTGKGDMLIKNENNIVPTCNINHKGSPYYNVDFIGGFDVIVNDQTINPDFYINYPPYNKEGVIWCNLTGHSMEPEISNGDIIALREVTTPIQYLPAGEIYGIVTEEYRTVKRVRLSQKKGYIRLIPSNKSDEYCEQEIPINMIIRVYAVLGSLRKFF
nr:MAG TPA: hypothetical protein [Caudoviricetes sp.]